MTLREIFFHGDYAFTAETDSPIIFGRADLTSSLRIRE
jgi:hypothetical protein